MNTLYRDGKMKISVYVSVYATMRQFIFMCVRLKVTQRLIWQR